MTVTQDVIRDLLTSVLAGDASADTRALVEDYLARDPALRPKPTPRGRPPRPSRPHRRRGPRPRSRRSTRRES